MKRVLAVVCGAALVIAVAASVMDSAEASNRAVVIKGSMCTVLDGNGNYVTDGGYVSVSTRTGRTVFQCRVRGAANDDGRTKITTGERCDTPGGVTFDSRNVASASGNVTLTCRI